MAKRLTAPIEEMLNHKHNDPNYAKKITNEVKKANKERKKLEKIAREKAEKELEEITRNNIRKQQEEFTKEQAESESQQRGTVTTQTNTGTEEKEKKDGKNWWGKAVSAKRWVGKKLYGKVPLWFLLFCLIIHVWDVLNGFRDLSPRLMLYIILMVFGWVTIFKREVGVINVEDLKIPAILSSIAFLVPYLGNVLPFLSNSQVFQTIIIFFPAWIIYLVFAMGETWYISLFRWGFIIFWLVLLLPIITTNLVADLNLSDVETGINVQQTMSNAGRDFSHGIKSIFKNIGDGLKDIGNNFMKIALGPYYRGEVEDNEHEPIGVYLENLGASDSKFFEGEKITVWSILKAKTLNDEINIKVSCYAKEGDKEITGNITPKNEFNIADEEEEYLDCTFERLNPGKKDVTFNAEFNFETMSYLKTYFMDKERLRSFKREGIDVFNHYKISHVNPIARYTNGPVGIGMRTQEPLPVGVYSNKDNNPFFFGITLENRWEGTIKRVTNLTVQVHDSLKLTNCDHKFEFNENKEGYNIYNLVPDKKTENIKQRKFHTIKCRLNPVDPKSLLGNEPITTRYFMVTAKYIYELEKSTPVEIEPVEDYKSPEEAMTSEEDIKELKESVNTKKICGKDSEEKAIIECKDYNANNYDKFGFSNQAWCDADPCDLKCYPSFKEKNSEIEYDSCMECNPTYTKYGIAPEETKENSFCYLYLTKEYCDKDPCDSKYSSGGISYTGCSWDESTNKCKMKPLKVGGWEGISEDKIELKIRGAASEYEIPEHIVLGIAKQESDMKHYDKDGSVKYHEVYSDSDKDGKDDKKQGVIGIMQVALNKVDLNQESNWCSSCMISKEGLKDLNINLRCGMLIFNEKYNTFCKSDGTAKTVGGGVSVFINSLNDCYDEYKKYDGNCLSMAIRAYNGLGCGKNADLDYVESVLSYAEGYK